MFSFYWQVGGNSQQKWGRGEPACASLGREWRRTVKTKLSLLSIVKSGSPGKSKGRVGRGVEKTGGGLRGREAALFSGRYVLEEGILKKKIREPRRKNRTYEWRNSRGAAGALLSQ